MDVVYLLLHMRILLGSVAPGYTTAFAVPGVSQGWNCRCIRVYLGWARFTYEKLSEDRSDCAQVLGGRCVKAWIDECLEVIAVACGYRASHKVLGRHGVAKNGLIGLWRLAVDSREVETKGNRRVVTNVRTCLPPTNHRETHVARIKSSVFRMGDGQELMEPLTTSVLCQQTCQSAEVRQEPSGTTSSIRQAGYFSYMQALLTPLLDGIGIHRFHW